METGALLDLFRGTLHPTQRKDAEEHISQLIMTPSFTPLLLQLTVSHDVELAIRQSIAIYLKNTIARYWHEDTTGRLGVTAFRLSEHDRELLRNNIIDAACQTPEPLILHQLGTCVNFIIRHDYPTRWIGIIDKINHYLQSSESRYWRGALLSFYQLAKTYEYSARENLIPAIKVLMPTLYRLMINIMNDDSNESLLLQKQIIKIYFAIVQFSLLMDFITKEIFAQWMEILRVIVDKRVPKYTNMDEDEMTELPIWKLKKWVLRTLHRVFYKYGSPGHCTDLYAEFASWYLTTFSCGILEVLLRTLQLYQNKCFVSPKALQHTLNYITHAINHNHTWKYLKPQMYGIIQTVVFPIMCHSDTNEELFVSDPKTYLRSRTDEIDDYLMPMQAAKTLLIYSCKKRKDLWQQSMEFCIFVLSDSAYNSRQKDGALHMIGSLSKVLFNKTTRDKIEDMLIQHILPEMSSTVDHVRARACWVIHCYAGAKIKNKVLLNEMTRLLVDKLLNDTSLPVKFEAAIGLQNFFNDGLRYLVTGNQVRPMMLELLELLRVTENDDLTSVIQKMFCNFPHYLVPVAVEITEHLGNSFIQVFEESPTCDEKAITAMALLNTIDTVMTLSMENDLTLRNLQPKVLFVVAHIFNSGFPDFYEEAFSLIYNMTTKFISQPLWPVLGEIYMVFQRSGQEYFIEMMPALHNYVTVDTTAFLSNEQYLLAIFNMCRVILTGDYGEDPECHAAKLLEVIILQCKGQINQAVPSFIQLAFSRLHRNLKTSELRVMCLQIVIAGLYYDPVFFLNTMQELQVDSINDTPMNFFIKQWLNDTDCFLGIHDRKISIIGLCTMLHLEFNHSSILGSNITKVIPSLVMLFDGLKKAYEMKELLEEQAESDGYDIPGTDDYKALSSDDEDNAVLRTKSEDKSSESNTGTNILEGADSGDSNYEDDYNGVDVTPLESYETILEKPDNTIDVYLVFKEIFSKMYSSQDINFKSLIENLPDNQKKSLEAILALADKNKGKENEFPLEQHQQAQAQGFTYSEM